MQSGRVFYIILPKIARVNVILQIIKLLSTESRPNLTIYCHAYLFSSSTCWNVKSRPQKALFLIPIALLQTLNNICMSFFHVPSMSRHIFSSPAIFVFEIIRTHAQTIFHCVQYMSFFDYFFSVNIKKEK